MKNEKIKFNKSKLVARVMLLILLLTGALNFSGCGVRNIENGFNWTETDGFKKYFCAYKSDREKFNIDDVTLTFYFGGLEGINLPSFKLYFQSASGEYYFVKEITVTDPNDYLVSIDEVLGDYIWKKSFNHSEIITIPKEALESGGASVVFLLASEYFDPEYWETGTSTNIRNQMFASILVDLIVEGETIVLERW